MGKIGKNTIPILIDTGADLSLVPKKLLPNDCSIKTTSQTARAANGGPIPILGLIENLQIQINDTLFSVRKALVTECFINYILIGAPEIVANPVLIQSILRINKEARTHNIEDPVSIRMIQPCDSRLISQAEEIKRRFSDIFITELSPSKLCSIKKHSILTGDHPPICQKEHRIPIHLEDKVKTEIDKLKTQGIIRPSESPWRSSLVIVPKDANKIRLCVDYRALNEITVKNAYPLPRIDDIIDTLSKAEIFSVMDATSGYHQIALEETDMKKTAFSWKGELYEYTRMPFGLCNAPATFQSIMNTVLREVNWDFTIPYLDDIIVFSQSVDEHRKHLEIVLGKLRAAGLSLNHEKSKFFQVEVEFLGNIISKDCVKPDPKKVLAITNCEPPETLRELRSFLGLANFCSPFIKQFASITAPLTDLLKGEVKASQKRIKWATDSIKAFKVIKEKISEITSRAQPDKSKEFILTTDASDIAMGAILSQRDDKGKERIIAYFSKKSSKHS